MSTIDRTMSKVHPVGLDETDEGPAESPIPFAIPLHPTPKSYRSQSYSVGQLDLEHPHSMRSGPLAVRVKPSQPPGLQHRPSRPSMLNDLARDGSSLHRVREAADDDDDDDDHHDDHDEDNDHGRALDGVDDEGDGSPRDVRGRRGRPTSAVVGASGAATTATAAAEPSTRDHGLWRSLSITASSSSSPEHARGRGRGSTSSTASAGRRPLGAFPHRIQASVPEESDYAVDEVDDLDHLQSFVGRDLTGRRLSEFGLDPDGRPTSLAFPEHRKIESLKKGYWQSSLGFAGVADGAQSRRHSFADVPARSGSIGSTVDALHAAVDAADLAHVRSGRIDLPVRVPDAVTTNTTTTTTTASLRTFPHNDAGVWPFGLGSPFAREVSGSSVVGPPVVGPRDAGRSSVTASSAASLPSHPVGPSSYGVDRAQSPLGGLRRGAFLPPAHAGGGGGGGSGARPTQPLCMVTFKCCRADVFHLPEGTGLRVTPGDMVIVEADRGTDLGTVTQTNITWEDARALKEHYAEEHYRCLMMFSRHAAQMGPVGSLRSAPAGPGSAVGGMGPHGGSGPPAAGPDAITADFRPKMIKRLAQAHEVQTLRDKEGNEAKAKRVCQQKVAEHRLQMEILDAEFQMSVASLPFFFFPLPPPLITFFLPLLSTLLLPFHFLFIRLLTR